MELHPKVAQALEEIDAQMFSGDISDPEILAKLKDYVFAWVRRISEELPENQEDWTPCAVCNGTGRSPVDRRERCNAHGGFMNQAQCEKPADHSESHHVARDKVGYSLSW